MGSKLSPCFCSQNFNEESPVPKRKERGLVSASSSTTPQRASVFHSVCVIAFEALSSRPAAYCDGDAVPQQKIRVCVMMERSSCGRVTVDLKTARTTTGMTAFPHILVTGSYGSKVLQDKSIQRSLRGVGLLNGRRPIESLVH